MLANISSNNMIGYVKRDNGWRVCYFRSVHNTTGLKEFSLPLHPEDVLAFEKGKKLKDEVSFEIVQMWLYGKVIYVAKLK
jgi:hypothetical protein